MVRQWQQLIHGGRYSESYTDSLPDFKSLAETFGLKGLRAENVDQLDDVIDQMMFLHFSLVMEKTLLEMVIVLYYFQIILNLISLL